MVRKATVQPREVGGLEPIEDLSNMGDPLKGCTALIPGASLNMNKNKKNIFSMTGKFCYGEL